MSDNREPVCCPMCRGEFFEHTGRVQPGVDGYYCLSCKCRFTVELPVPNLFDEPTEG